jgi:hypothetical protein
MQQQWHMGVRHKYLCCHIMQDSSTSASATQRIKVQYNCVASQVRDSQQRHYLHVQLLVFGKRHSHRYVAVYVTAT